MEPWHYIYTRQDDWNDSGDESWGDGDGHYGGMDIHHSHGMWTNNSGRSHSHENRPPYYAVTFIMRIR